MENEIVKQEAKAVAVREAIPAEEQFVPLDSQDALPLPRLILAQGGLNNKLIKEGAAKDGELLNSLSHDIYGSEVEVVLLFQLPNARIRWIPKTEGGGIRCKARDGNNAFGVNVGEESPSNLPASHSCPECPLYNLRDGKTGCSSNYQIVGMVRSTKEPILFTGDIIKPSDRGIRDMLGLARSNYQTRKLAIFNLSYVIKSVAAESKGFNFFKMAVSIGNNNQPLPQDEIDFYESQFRLLKGSKIEVVEDEEGAPKDW